MFLRRGPLGLFLIVGFGLLLGAALFGGTEAVGSVVAAPFVVLGFMFKIVLSFMLFGLIAKLFAGSARRGKNWSGPRHEWWSDEDVVTGTHKALLLMLSSAGLSD